MMKRLRRVPSRSTVRAAVAIAIFACYPVWAMAATDLIASISASDRVDMVDDLAQNILYISCSDGNLLRYSLSSDSMLAPISLGGSLAGVNISPDGSTLVVADRSGGLNVVNLATLTSRKISISSDPSGSWQPCSLETIPCSPAAP